LTSAWAFAVDAWARPGVEAICLDLQNTHDQLPALLLWRCWTLVEDRPVDAGHLAKAVEIARTWESEVLGPLRALRQRLATTETIADVARASLRRRILEAELEAEHALLDALETLEIPKGPAWGAAADSRLEAMTRLAGLWRPPAPSAALGRLVEAL
jgi:uncharacterized protein (TIGR02444 family)